MNRDCGPSAGLALIYISNSPAPSPQGRLRQRIADVPRPPSLCRQSSASNQAITCEQYESPQYRERKAHQEAWSREITRIIDSSITHEIAANEATDQGTDDANDYCNEHSSRISSRHDHFCNYADQKTEEYPRQLRPTSY